MQCCEKVVSLPESFYRLSNLKKLDFYKCEKLASLPERIGDLKNLQELDLDNCKQLLALPEGIPAHIPSSATSELRMNCHRDISSSVFA